jgi:hypothetical protein
VQFRRRIGVQHTLAGQLLKRSLQPGPLNTHIAGQGAQRLPHTQVRHRLIVNLALRLLAQSAQLFHRRDPCPRRLVKQLRRARRRRHEPQLRRGGKTTRDHAPHSSFVFLLRYVTILFFVPLLVYLLDCEKTRCYETSIAFPIVLVITGSCSRVFCYDRHLTLLFLCSFLHKKAVTVG